MPQLFTNNISTVLAASKPAGATTLLLPPGVGARFPQPVAADDYFMVTLFKIVKGAETGFEIVRCTGRNLDTLTIIGAQDGTPPGSFVAGDKVSMRLTAEWLNGAESSSLAATRAITANTTAISAVATKTAAISDTIYEPKSQSKKVVVFGSSVALGDGAVLYRGWAYKLGQAMASRGYTFVNKSVGGNNTTNLIQRFYTDVVPEHPDLVIIGLGLGNEGLVSGNKEVVYSSYVRGIRRLVTMCRQAGFKVIVAGVYCNNFFTLTDYQYLRQADLEFENSDVPYINFLGAVDDGTGKWRDGMWNDALHPNEQGHEAIFRAFPLSLFDNLLSPVPSVVDTSNQFTVTMPNTTGVVPLSYVSESPFGSFTVMCKVRRKPGASGGKPIISIESTLNSFTSVRVRNPVDDYGLAIGDNTLVQSDVRSSYNETNHMTLTYDYFSGNWRFYIDGKLIGTTVYAADANNFNRVCFGTRSDAMGGFNVENYEFSEMAVWRSALNIGQIVEAMNGRYPKASMNLLSPCADPAVGLNSRLVNLAPSDTYAIVGVAGATMTPSRKITGIEFERLMNSRGFVVTNEVVAAPIRYTAAASSGNFTAFIQFRMTADSALGKGIMSVANAGVDVIRIRVHPAGYIDVVNAAGNSVISSTKFPADRLPVQAAFRYDSARGTIELVIDGVLRGSFNTGVITYTDIVFAGSFVSGLNNPTAYEIWNMGVYNTMMSDAQLLRAVGGEFRTDSILALTAGYEKQYAANSTIAPALTYAGTVPMLSVR